MTDTRLRNRFDTQSLPLLRNAKVTRSPALDTSDLDEPDDVRRSPP